MVKGLKNKKWLKAIIATGLVVVLSLLLLKSCSQKETNEESNTDSDSSSEVIVDNSSKEDNTETVVDDNKQEETIIEDTKHEDEKEEQETTLSYWVNFLNIDGSTLQRSRFEKGTKPSYNGETPTYSDGVYTYTFTGWDKSISTVYMTQTYTAVYSKVAIAKKDSTPQVVNPVGKTNLVYNGLAQELITAGANATFTYSLNGGAYSSNIPTATNAGDYTIYYKINGGTEQSLNVNIAKKDIVVTATDKESYIGSDLVSLTYTSDSLCGTDTFTGALVTTADKNIASNYDITQGTLTAGDNYSINYTKGTYIVGDWLAFSSDDDFTLGVDEYGAQWAKTDFSYLEISTDNKTWNKWNGTNVAAIQTGDKYYIYLRGVGLTTLNQTELTLIPNCGLDYIEPTTNTGMIDCTGNVMTLLDYKNPNAVVMDEETFECLFYGCEALKTAPSLPATTLADSCYSHMFYNCTSLTVAPELPATNLAEYCYYGMFDGCTSLTTAPTLPATNLAEYCYCEMFASCESLTTLPISNPNADEFEQSYLPAENLVVGCYSNMFNGCTSLKVGEGNAQDIENKIFILPNIIPENSITDMFKDTVGDFEGTPDDTTNDNIYYWYTNNCLAAGTKITMADGSFKNIENIDNGDLVLTFNHEKGVYEGQEVFLAYHGEYKSKSFTIHFENGNTISIVGEHDLFEKESLKYVTIFEASAEQFIGKHFYSVADGKYLELTAVTYDTEAVDFYSLYVSYNKNCIANGMLSLPDDIDFTLNFYEFNEDLTANLDVLATDFDKYGIFESAHPETYSGDNFNAIGGKYFNIIVGKGLITWDELYAVEEYYHNTY